MTEYNTSVAKGVRSLKIIVKNPATDIKEYGDMYAEAERTWSSEEVVKRVAMGIINNAEPKDISIVMGVGVEDLGTTEI